MLLHGCFYIGVSGPLIQYLKMFKKFSLGAELQPLRVGSGGRHSMDRDRWCLVVVVPRQWAAGLRRETIAGNNPFLLHVMVHVLQGVKAKVPFPQFRLNNG